MELIEKAILNKKPNFNKLSAYGFKKHTDGYIYSTDIMENSFLLNIIISPQEKVKLKVIDKETNDEYGLINNPQAVGAFVGRMREACESIFNDIAQSCYESNIFKSDQAKAVVDYVSRRYGIKPEFLWEKTPNNAIFRDKKSEKWFVVFLTLEKRKLGIKKDGLVEVINLKESPENILKLVDGKSYFAGFHMNKKHWYTLCLDGSVPIGEIYSRIDKSFELIKK